MAPILVDLHGIVSGARQAQRSQAYTISLLKEYFQALILNYLFADSQYGQNLIFTGGTCLRHCYGLNRLSEDLDFDLIQPINETELVQDLTTHFQHKYDFTQLELSIKQRGQQILCKFLILRELGLADLSSSDQLHVKLDFSPLVSEQYDTLKSLQNQQGLNYLVTHYDLSSLMAGKLHAVLRRQRLRGVQNLESIKGRDYFDLLWFLRKEVMPNMQRLSDLLGEPITNEELFAQLTEKVTRAVGPLRSEFKRDILPFIEDAKLADGFVEGYGDAYQEAVRYLIRKK